MVISVVITTIIVASISVLVISENSTPHKVLVPSESALLVIIGGFDGPIIYEGSGSPIDNVHIYTVHAGHVTWKREGRPAPYPWYRGGTAASGGNIYIMGGAVSGLEFPRNGRQAAKYNVRDDTWDLLPEKNLSALLGPAVYVMKNKLYAADGGQDIETERLDLSDVVSGWTREQASPTHDVHYTQAVIIRNTVYICAGTYNRAIKTVISWTYGKPAWTPVADMNIARYSHGTVTDGISNIWVIAGCEPYDCWPDGFIEQYSVTTNTWTKLNHVPNIQRDYYEVEVCAFWQGYIYVIFYSHLQDVIPTFHVYNTETGKWHQDNTELVLPTHYSMSALVP